MRCGRSSRGRDTGTPSLAGRPASSGRQAGHPSSSWIMDAFRVDRVTWVTDPSRSVRTPNGRSAGGGGPAPVLPGVPVRGVAAAAGFAVLSAGGAVRVAGPAVRPAVGATAVRARCRQRRCRRSRPSRGRRTRCRRRRATRGSRAFPHREVRPVPTVRQRGPQRGPSAAQEPNPVHGSRRSRRRSRNHGPGPGSAPGHARSCRTTASRRAVVGMRVAGTGTGAARVPCRRRGASLRHCHPTSRRRPA